MRASINYLEIRRDEFDDAILDVHIGLPLVIRVHHRAALDEQLAPRVRRMALQSFVPDRAGLHTKNTTTTTTTRSPNPGLLDLNLS